VHKSPAPDSACLDEVEVSDGVLPSRSSFVVVVVGSRWCFALRASLEPGERLLINHLRDRPTGGRVSCDVSDSANAKGLFLSVGRSERSEFMDAAVCGSHTACGIRRAHVAKKTAGLSLAAATIVSRPCSDQPESRKSVFRGDIEMT
jgi:hypothetical protein